ncbi:hypothetical protein CLCR_07990 [Cladophialophora carrionii]|uniref:Pentatricopeptide repeat protein n=1 Tax=Cladophialophora carrionii TaxID=86049 RepID=A0A1C1CRU5_9EURO|nr:hypothetical protein CLCR_07990 [Cladophialophora carrionii]
MFTCDACLRRALFSLGGPSRTAPRFTLQPLERAINPTNSFSRSHATLESLRKGHHRHSLFEALKDRRRKVSVPKVRPSNPRSRFNTRHAEAVENNRLKRLEPDAREKYLKRAMRQESKYLVDPLKLAQGVVEKLRDHQFDEALELVRASEKSRDGKGVENIVSWNHIIDWLMSQDSPGEAWKVYNEMKKRGHKPDSHTYTIMLRGYRHNVKKPNAVQQAMSVYDSISAANSAVTPTTIHTNAVLSVCARAHDVDAMWKIAGRLPERGPGAPDHVTFTTILQGLNGEAQKRAIEQGARAGPGFNPQPIFDQVIDDARKLWLDITARWRRGYLHIDETLVCAMGRLLMLSDDKQTQKDVLSLVHQTMNIAKMSQAPDAERQDDAQEDDEVGRDEQRPSTIDAPARITPRSDPSARQVSTTNSSVYATPGTNTLSMLIETATALRELKLGKYYWELLTAENGSYKIVPDHQNIMAYLRLLRVSRASRAVLDVLREPRPEEVNHKLMVRGTFIIAMSTCLRDKKNPNVFETASRIMDLMQESTEDMSGRESEEDADGQRLRFSPKVLRMYLEIAIATTKGINGEALEKTKNGDLDFERDPSKNPTMRALRRLSPDIMNVRQMIKSYLIDIEQQASIQERTIRVKKLLEKRKITPYSTNENIADLIELLRTMIGAIDKIILVNEKLEDEGMGPLDKEILNECWLQKRKLSAFVSKYANAVVEPRNPSEIRARRVNEQGHRLSRRHSQEHIEVDSVAEPTKQVDSTDDDLTDPSVPAPSPRAKILSDIQSAQEKVLKKSEERGLSRRQKLELLKKETTRAQFPASMLRQQETPRRVLRKQDTKAAARERTREMLESGSGGERKVPVWKASQAARTLSRETRNERRAREKEDRRRRREEVERGETAKGDRMQSQKETYRGWGGGFEELAKEEGGNLGEKAGVIELGP